MTWDSESHTYIVGTGEVQGETVSYSVDGNDNAVKELRITNDSNFKITRSVHISNEKFNIDESNEEIAIGGSAVSNITIDPSKFSNFMNNSYTSVGTATINMSAAGDIKGLTS